jgi:hypothetical protein
MDEDNCGNCKFIFENEGMIVCRRYPPTIIMSLGNDILTGAMKPRIGSHYPPTAVTHSCGCFQVKETVQ